MQCIPPNCSNIKHTEWDAQCILLLVALRLVVALRIREVAHEGTVEAELRQRRDALNVGSRVLWSQIAFARAGGGQLPRTWPGRRCSPRCRRAARS